MRKLEKMLMEVEETLAKKQELKKCKHYDVFIPFNIIFSWCFKQMRVSCWRMKEKLNS